MAKAIKNGIGAVGGEVVILGKIIGYWIGGI